MISNRASVGQLLLFGSFITGVGILIAEGLYGSDYNPRDYTISDLARKVEPGIVLNLSLIVSGFLIAIAAYGLYKAYTTSRIQLLSALLAVSALGMIGIGLYSIYTGPIHQNYALITFGASTLAILLATFSVHPRFKFFTLVADAVAAIALIGMFTGLRDLLGAGGVERVLTYACLFWTSAFGAYLLLKRSTMLDPQAVVNGVASEEEREKSEVL